jgi:hypothetical protein
LKKKDVTSGFKNEDILRKEKMEEPEQKLKKLLQKKYQSVADTRSEIS